MLKNKEWSRIIFGLWLYTLLVILWGAWVRISHSGDGCGDHWPLCDGQLLPSFENQKTWVEYSHRIMSGVYGIIIFYIFFRFKKHTIPLVRKLNLLLFILMIIEALLGALLVKGNLVTVNDSIFRLIVMSFHQLNSFLLTGVVFLFAHCLRRELSSIKISNPILVLIFLALPITGAIAALATTLFPSISLWQGMLEDFSHNSHLFIRLRALHPIMATFIASYFIYWCYKKNLNRLSLYFLLAFFIGVITLLSLSPTYLKLSHLLIAHCLWVALIHTLVSLPDSKSL